MKSALNFVIIIVFTSIICCNPKKQPQVDNGVESLVDDYSFSIDSLIKTGHPRIFNGVVLITKDGEEKYLKEYGFSDFDKRTPISIDDGFRIMSNSKQVTAVLILKEAEKGNLSLHDPISQYLPDLTQTWADSITIHQLLNMSSGIVGLEEPLLFEPGKGYHYSNPGYGLLGRIIKKVTGKPYSENADQLFKELGMKNTYCYGLNKDNGTLISSYAYKKGEPEFVDFERFGFNQESWDDFLPAGGIVSNTYDLMKWDAKLHNGKILDTQYYEKLIKPTNSGPHAVFDYDTLGYSYGIRVDNKRPKVSYGHGGRGFGFVSLKLYIPKVKVGIIVWENIYHMDGFPNNADIIYHFENEIRKIVLNSSLYN